MRRLGLPAGWIAALCIMVASLAVVIASQQRLSHTKDEPAHIIAGMEWWQEGRYTLEPIHPPLARAVMAAPLYLSGVRTMHPLPPGHKDYHYLTQTGLTLLAGDGQYAPRLMLARRALLPFYLLSMVVVFLWSRRLYGMVPALVSLTLYDTLPPILAHAGLATTDMPYVSLCVLALYMLVRWLERPDLPRSVLSGVALALAVTTKFSAVVHIPAAFIAMLAGRYIHRSKAPIRWRAYAIGICCMIPAAALYIAAIYRFAPITPLISGLHDLYLFNRHGRALWLFGPLHEHAVWYFFPVLLFFKTPLPFLAAALVAICLAFAGDRRGVEPFLAAAAILLVSMASHINLGIRHILIVYPLLAIPSGQAAMRAFQWLKGRKIWMAWPVVFLLSWQCASVWQSFPEFIAYYNLLAGAHPERINIDSDFDWEQNLFLLKAALNRRHVTKAHQCFGEGVKAADARHVESQIMPNVRFLSCAPRPASGWVIASVQLETISPKKFAWLDAYEPIEKIGQTLELYYLKEPTHER